MSVVLAFALVPATSAQAAETSYDAFNTQTLTPVPAPRGVFRTKIAFDSSDYSLQAGEAPKYTGCSAATKEGNRVYYGARSAWVQYLPPGSGQLNFKLTWPETPGFEPMVKFAQPAPPLGETPTFASLEGVMGPKECLAHAEEGVPIKNQFLRESGDPGWHVSITNPGELIDIAVLSVYCFPKETEGWRPPECDTEHEEAAVGAAVELEVEFIPDDTDGDGVPDGEDHCPKTPALGGGIPVTVHGCPDTDGDGIPDNDEVEHVSDACPAEAGQASANGCPDRDEDGLRDSEDHCPAEFSRTTSGCPDSDGDGVPDRDPVSHVEDHCPREAGPAVTNGCPDSDADGVPDDDPVAHVQDQCASLPGLARFEGCPDSDGDGQADDHDACPREWADIAHSQAAPGRLGCVSPLDAALHYAFGRATPRKQLMRYFNVEAPMGASVTLQCAGRACPRRALPVTFTVTKPVVPMIGYLRRGKLRRGRQVWIPVGTTISATVTDDGTLGRRRSLTPTRTGEPKVVDQCVAAGKVVRCA